MTTLITSAKETKLSKVCHNKHSVSGCVCVYFPGFMYRMLK